MPDIMFQGTAGKLEGKYVQGGNAKAPIAVILHPHPQHGGTMNNKVTYTLYKTFFEKGFNVLRFNFRGIGRSQGSYDNGEGELRDATSALDWMTSMHPNASDCWIAGFSFGAWISMQLLMRRPELRGFIAVSPPADRYDFNFLAPCPISGQIIQGGADTIVTPASVEKLATKLKSQKNIAIDYQLILDADHFFKNALDDLSKRAGLYLDNHCTYFDQKIATS